MNDRESVCVRENLLSSSRDVVRNQGKWNNHEVAIKLLDRDNVPVNLQLRLEIKAMRDIRHKNLAAFVGACCSSPNVCTLMELGPKGSLDDLLSSDSINFDWNFKYSLLKVSLGSRSASSLSSKIIPGHLPRDELPGQHSNQVPWPPQGFQLCGGQPLDPQDHW